MLDLASPRWTTLRHAAAASTDVPALLAALAADPADARGHAVWDQLYASLCPEEASDAAAGVAIPEAAYAAVPHVVELAAAQPRREQTLFWVFVGEIASRRQGAIPDDVRADYEAAIARAEALIRDALGPSEPPLDENDALQLLAALAAVRGHAATARALGGLVDGELCVDCPSCARPLFVSVDGVPFVVSPEAPMMTGTARQTLVSPPSPPPAIAADPDAVGDEADATGYLLALARRAGQPELADRLFLWEGTAECPICGHRFALRPAAVAGT